jgi:serine/threonine-protein kinase
MGEVYRAEDTTLKREVAIKVLPEQFTKDPQRLARFEREAQLLASLNHPNIAAIHSFEHSDDIHFLVLELVEGETLAERVGKGPVPVDEALEVCRQIAEGVEAAHEKGVIHRDLKPANVKVTPEGKVKILDFGLAKAFEGETPVTDISQSPTLTEEMTRAGVILGTAAYMSPEQAKGKSVDKRADIFAFGAVLYELLTGKRAFEGETITETLGAIIHKEPDWEALPGATPWRIQDLLRRCLQKDVHDRLDGIANVRIEVKLALYEPATESPTAVASALQPPVWRRAIPWSITVMVVLIAVVGFWILTRPEVRPVSRFAMMLPSDQQLTPTGRHAVALSPDGEHLVYTVNDQLYLRAMDQLEATTIRGTEGARGPFFSPDGQWVGFWVGGQLKKVSISGGAPVNLCEAAIPYGATWGQDDTIVFGQGSEGIWQVPATGGTKEVLISLDPEKNEIGHGPQILPGGEAVLFTLREADTSVWDDSQIVVQSLETGEQKVLVNGGKDARYLPTGHLVYARQGTLLVIPFDVGRLEATSGPVPIVEGVMDAGASTGAAYFSFSDLGSLVYVASLGGINNSLVWVDRDGTELEPAAEEVLEYPRYPRISPDGQRIALTVGPGNRGDLWVFYLDGRPATPLTFQGHNLMPTWSPDGKKVAFVSDRSGQRNLFWMPADGSTLEPEPFLESPNSQRSPAWSPDGRELIFTQGTPQDSDIWALSLEGDSQPREVVATDYRERLPALSRNGKWLAYESNVTGQDEIWVRPYPGPGPPIRISSNGGTEPVWGIEDREILFYEGPKLMAATVEIGEELRFERAEMLFEGKYIKYPNAPRPYDVAPDGRLLMIKGADDTQARDQINVVLNWFEELKRLVPTN